MAISIPVSRSSRTGTVAYAAMLAKNPSSLISPPVGFAPITRAARFGVAVTFRYARANDHPMTKKTSTRAKTTRGSTKAKAKTKKVATPKRVTRKTPAAKKAPARAATKAAARPRKPTSSVGAWPGLPPGYFDRSR